jgi:hypothetical protein
METNNSLEGRVHENFIRAPKIVGNTILGVGMGLACLIESSMSFYVITGLVPIGFNSSEVNIPKSDSLKRHVGELLTYSIYSSVVSTGTNLLGLYFLNK